MVSSRSTDQDGLRGFKFQRLGQQRVERRDGLASGTCEQIRPVVAECTT